MPEWSPDLENTPVTSVTAFGVEVKPGDRVRIWPQKSADIMDMALKGKVAIIETIERDFEDHIHLAVVMEDDPGRDLGMLRQPGHRFFFSPEEIEPLNLNSEVSHER
jgi:ABC-type Fe3+ transport system substrate-binding protein